MGELVGYFDVPYSESDAEALAKSGPGYFLVLCGRQDDAPSVADVLRFRVPDYMVVGLPSWHIECPWDGYIFDIHAQSHGLKPDLLRVEFSWPGTPALPPGFVIATAETTRAQLTLQIARLLKIWLVEVQTSLLSSRKFVHWRPENFSLDLNDVVLVGLKIIRDGASGGQKYLVCLSVRHRQM